ncbi:MAG TPA: BMP family ABC transporter substrate-binding protein [Clostridiaceae bacterium]|nr:BMP family ABC transporter substrate-binding protein [Clostridiaceae bacterium]
MKTRTKIISIVLLVVLLIATVACGGNGDTKDDSTAKPRVAMVSYMAVDEAEWLQNLVAGVEQYLKDNPDRFEFKVIEATQPNEYEPKIKAACEEGYDIVITTYDNMAAATIVAAEQYPDVKFGTLDGGIENLESYKNIQDFRLSRVETGFLAGIVGAKMSKTNKLGIVAGADVGSINEIIAGWQQGMRYVNNEIEDVVMYANTFTDPTKGKELGLALINQGCDVIGGAAGGTGVGVAQAAAEKGTYYVAWDVHYPDVVPDLELCSALNYFDKMVLAFINDAISDNYQPGKTTIYGVKEGAAALGYLDNNLISDEIKKFVEEVADKVAAGEIELKLEPIHK